MLVPGCGAFYSGLLLVEYIFTSASSSHFSGRLVRQTLKQSRLEPRTPQANMVNLLDPRL